MTILVTFILIIIQIGNYINSNVYIYKYNIQFYNSDAN